MAGVPPMDPGTMTPASKSALGASLGLETPPPPLSGAGVVPDGDLSDLNVAEVRQELDDAYGQQAGFQAEARDVILASPTGSSATEGYHLDQQAEMINDQGHLDVGPVPDGAKPEERA